MRMLLHAKIPHKEFNAAVRDGSAEKKIKQILEETKAEAVYFTEYDGQRGAILIININDPSEVPRFAEPWFLSFNADVQFHIVMTPEELGRSGLEKIGGKWS
ncbi:MAG TPA: panthothenate synthetase [Thermodesulfobacteriota bacterium]|nr:panthothenate synthetase [Thermodesulfobacteriota bacterium]